MERKKLTRRVGMFAALVGVMALAACDTQPATNVTADAATLNAKGACTAGTSGNWWYQLRNASLGGGWGDVGPAHPYSCGQNTGEVAFESYRVGGLNPGNLYQFRLRATVNGPSSTFDAAGTQNGTNYDSFRTRDFSSESGGDDGQTLPGDCRPGENPNACASSYPYGKKIGLTNRMLWVFANGAPFEFDVADHRAFFDWGFNLETHNIRWIDKSGMSRCLVSIGSCNVEYGKWMLEICDRTGPDTCLFRREASVNVSFTYKIAFNRHLVSCVGTRINWDGTHMRNTWEGDCSAAGAASAAMADLRNEDLVLGKGKDAVPVGRYLTRADIASLDGACIRRTADERECRTVAVNLYRSLPDEVRAKVEAGR